MMVQEIKSGSSVTVEWLASNEGCLLLDVRKQKAREQSGMTIPSAIWRPPFSADQWCGEINELAGSGRIVVVFCVHGHEVSQAVSGRLRDDGLKAVFLECGFEHWRGSGRPTVAIVDADIDHDQ